ncbi:hypothetical protein HMPREF9969_1953 [Prevotella sp. oral taxon 306 str. F0472]|nr:hypothetical protein HMPREF9969_1953 [Prevotella sp. oral taxon 306 str. F0472]
MGEYIPSFGGAWGGFSFIRGKPRFEERVGALDSLNIIFRIE